MSDDAILSHAEALTEIRRLRSEAERWQGTIMDQDAVIDRLRAELHEATQLVLRLQKERFVRDVEHAFADGALAEPRPEPPFHVEHDVPPSTPR